MDTSIKKVVNYCPDCCNDRLNEKPKKTSADVIIVAKECKNHQQEFFETGTGIMVPKKFLPMFRII